MMKPAIRPSFRYGPFAVSIALHVLVGLGLALVFWVKPTEFRIKGVSTAIGIELSEVRVNSPVTSHPANPPEAKKLQNELFTPVAAETSSTSSGSIVQSNVSRNDVLTDYLAQLNKIIDRHKFYPRLSLSSKEAGVVKAKIEVDANGRIVSSNIESSSGYVRLDAAAITLLNNIADFPAVPRELNPPLSIIVPIRYEPGNQP